MREWWVIYDGGPRSNPKAELFRRGELWGPHFASFDKVAAAGAIHGRPMRAMWMIDPATKQARRLRRASPRGTPTFL